MKFNKEVTNKDIIEVIKEKYNIINEYYEDKGNVVDFKDMKLARQMLLETEKPMIIIDSDADGISSASGLVYYFNKMNKEYTLIAHEKKSHGINDKEKELYLHSDCDLLIIPDAGSNNVLEIEDIIKEKPVLVLDHHIIEEKNMDRLLMLKHSNNFNIISTQLNKELNANLTGSFVVLETLKGLIDDDMLYTITMIGEVGDCGDTSDYYIHGMVDYGLNHLTDNYFLSLFLDNKASQRDLSFSIIPMINAICRIGNAEQNQVLVELLANVFSKEVYKVVEKRKKNKQTGKFDKVEVEQNIYEYYKDSFTSLKQKQTRLVDKEYNRILKELLCNDKIVVGLIDEEYTSLSGLIANKLMHGFNKPAFVLSNIDGKYIGSVRSNSGFDLKEDLSKKDYIEFAQGHYSAFGVCVLDLDKFLKEYHNKEELDKVNDSFIEVDLLRDELKLQDILDVDNNKRLFGGNISYPNIGYKEIRFSKENCTQNKNTIRFKKDGVEVILFKKEEGLLQEKMPNGFGENVLITFYGTPNVNHFFGTQYQIVAEDFSIKEDQEIMF